MEFCGECGSLMHTEGDTWVCRSCQNEESRDSQAEAAMATHDGQRDDGAPAVADATQGATETMREPCPADDCDSDRAYSEMMPKPGGSYSGSEVKAHGFSRGMKPTTGKHSTFGRLVGYSKP